jgi:hypothetical protein
VSSPVPGPQSSLNPIVDHEKDPCLQKTRDGKYIAVPKARRK